MNLKWQKLEDQDYKEYYQKKKDNKESKPCKKVEKPDVYKRKKIKKS